jgi:hypothetical protein
VSFSVIPATAVVSIYRSTDAGDELFRESAQSPIELTAQSYRFHAHLDGFIDADETIALTAEQPMSIRIELKPVERKTDSWNPPLQNPKTHKKTPGISWFGEENASGTYTFEIHVRKRAWPRKDTFGNWTVGNTEFRVEGKTLQSRVSGAWKNAGDLPSTPTVDKLFVRIQVDTSSVIHAIGPNLNPLTSFPQIDVKPGKFGFNKDSDISEFSHQ